MTYAGNTRTATCVEDLSPVVETKEMAFALDDYGQAGPRGLYGCSGGHGISRMLFQLLQVQPGGEITSRLLGRSL